MKDVCWNPGTRIVRRDDETLLVNLTTEKFMKIRNEAAQWLSRCVDCGYRNIEPALPEREKFIDLVEILKKEHYLLDREFYEKNKDKPLMREQMFNEYGNKYGRMVYYEVTDRCNQCCKFCFNKPKGRASKFDGDTEDGRKTIDHIKSVLNARCLIITGGEPLLRKDIHELVAHAKTRIPQVCMQTNGTLLDEDYAVKLKDAGLDIIQISCESPDESVHDSLRGKGNHKKTLEAIRLFKQAGFKKNQIVMTATLNNHTYAHLDEYKDFAEKHGVSSNLSMYQHVGRGSENDEFALSDDQLNKVLFGVMTSRKADVLDQIKDPNEEYDRAMVPAIKNECGMLVKTIAVKQNGNVVPCHLFLSSKDFIVGNIFDADILRKIYLAYRAIPRVDDIDKCKDCDVRYFCGNGCFANTYWTYGTFKHANPYCSFFEDYFKSIIWNLGKKEERKTILTELLKHAVG
jgi:radical SAM protein with 4Fe4S-binding SPASM domain